LSENPGSLKLLKTSGAMQTCTGIALPLTLKKIVFLLIEITPAAQVI
jgi:hypothetical protein